MRDVSKDVIETLLDEELTGHLGFEKYDQRAKDISGLEEKIISMYAKGMTTIDNRPGR